MPTTVDHRPRLPALTGLRFVAILHITLFHIAGLWGGSDRYPWWVKNFLLNRSFSTGMFFVLSGFLFVYIYYKNGEAAYSPFNFVKLRLSRLYPLHVLCLLWASPFALLGGQHLSPMHFGIAFVSTVFLGHAWIPWTICINQPSWTLSSLLLCYFIFLPLINRIIGPLTLKEQLLLFIPVYLIALLPITVIAGISQFAAVPSLKTYLDILHTNPLFSLPFFIAGCIAGKRFLDNQGGPAEKNSLKPDIVLLTCLCSLMILPGESFFEPFLRSGLLLSLQVYVIWILAKGAGRLSRLLSTRFFILLGNASFSMFLIQFPLYFSTVKAYRCLLALFRHGWKINMSSMAHALTDKSGGQVPAEIIVLYFFLLVTLSCIAQKHFVDKVYCFLRKKLAVSQRTCQMKPK